MSKSVYSKSVTVTRSSNKVSQQAIAALLTLVAAGGGIAPAIAQFVPSELSSPRPGLLNTEGIQADGYVPPDGGSAPASGTTGSNGVRGSGCSATTTNGLLLLAPQSHIGQTVSTQPTFMWFTSERDPYLVKFTLAQYVSNDNALNQTDDLKALTVIYTTDFLLTEHTQPSGIGSISLSETDVQLQPNTHYRWQVVIVCDPNRPSESLVAEADMAVVDTPDMLAANLAAATDRIEYVSFYAQSGLWYDAFAATMGLNDALSTQIELLEDLVIAEAERESQRMDSLELSQPPLNDEIRNDEIRNDETYSKLLQQVINRIGG